MPPQEPLARPSINPPAIAFAIAYLISLCLIADMNKYIASIPRNRPNGSDLNHPRLPLWMMAGLNAIKRAENIPADVPPRTLTRAKTTMTVRAPMIAGNAIVKSRSDIPPPKALYMYAAVMCSTDRDVVGTFLPSGYHDIVSCQCQ